jgi:subtilisin family serine protease
VGKAGKGKRSPAKRGKATGGADNKPPRAASRKEQRAALAHRPGFVPESLSSSIIALPLLDKLDDADEWRQAEPKPEQTPDLGPYHVIIDLNLNYEGERAGARQRVEALLTELEEAGYEVEPDYPKSDLAPQYIFARMSGDAIRELARLDNPRSLPPEPEAPSSTTPAGGTPPPAKRAAPSKRAIYRIWPDFEAHAFLTKSVSTVKADAARSSFAASGREIVWAVIDSGIAGDHPHFAKHENLKLTAPLKHYDFSVPEGTEETALTDEAGHGTHVAGIIAGELPEQLNAAGEQVVQARAVTRHFDERGDVGFAVTDLHAVSGVAPRCKLVSFKVLDPGGRGLTSSIIAAIAQIQEINGYGRRLLIQGVNLSLGYDFQPEWFACGQSPLCVEVDRLVRSGVVVVAASGNTGYGFHTSKFEGTVAAGMDLSINDPGNAELAITVGATHRDMPHTYGVSYFSSKGPTGDGRLKPDVVAPGEKIISCAAGASRREAEGQASVEGATYVEQSGTSMAAPHVSGIAAAFLSVRREFIGKPEAVKRIFMETATDLKRDRYFQGAGLVDLMRAIQSV